MLKVNEYYVKLGIPFALFGVYLLFEPGLFIALFNIGSITAVNLALLITLFGVFFLLKSI